MTWAEFIALILVRSGFSQGQTCPGYDWAAALPNADRMTIEQGFQHIAFDEAFRPRWAHFLCCKMSDLMTQDQIGILYNIMRADRGKFMARVDFDVDYRVQGFENMRLPIIAAREDPKLWIRWNMGIWRQVENRYEGR